MRKMQEIVLVIQVLKEVVPGTIPLYLVIEMDCISGLYTRIFKFSVLSFDAQKCTSAICHFVSTRRFGKDVPSFFQVRTIVINAWIEQRQVHRKQRVSLQCQQIRG